MAVKGKIEVDRERCKGCDVCVVACPTNVLALADEVNSKGYHYCMIDEKSGGMHRLRKLRNGVSG